MASAWMAANKSKTQDAAMKAWDSALLAGPTCPSCGVGQAAGYKFCTSCGNMKATPAAAPLDAPVVADAVPAAATTSDLADFLSKAKLEAHRAAFEESGARQLADIFFLANDDLAAMGFKPMEAKRCLRMLLEDFLAAANLEAHQAALKERGVKEVADIAGLESHELLHIGMKTNEAKRLLGMLPKLFNAETEEEVAAARIAAGMTRHMEATSLSPEEQEAAAVKVDEEAAATA